MKDLIVVFLLFILTTLSYSQIDSTASDKVYLNDGSSMTGKVITVKKDAVSFLDNTTKLSYELEKSDIKLIVLSTGQTLSFKGNTTKTNESKTQEEPKSKTNGKDDGPDTALIILASIGGVLALLLIIGAIASSGR